MIILLYFFYFQDIHMAKSLRIFSSFMTVGLDAKKYKKSYPE